VLSLMVKYKCVKLQCPECQVVGSAQLFLNNKNEITYARIRHYKALNENKKPKFDYHKINDLNHTQPVQMAPVM